MSNQDNKTDDRQNNDGSSRRSQRSLTELPGLRLDKDNKIMNDEIKQLIKDHQEEINMRVNRMIKEREEMLQKEFEQKLADQRRELLKDIKQQQPVEIKSTSSIQKD